MKGLGVFFNTSEEWKDMLIVFQRSWEMHMDIPLQIIERKPPKKTNRLYGLDTNTEKLNIWVDNFDEDTIFCDCDMMVRASIEDGFDKVENIGYTIRKRKGRPFNAGVIFAKYTDYSKRFLKAWQEANQKMYQDEKLRRKYSKIVPGMNQPALAYLFDQGWEADKIPEAYNMCDLDRWKDGKMIHIKSEVRTLCLGHQSRRVRNKNKAGLRSVFRALLGDRANRPRKVVDVKKASRRRRRRN